MKQLAKTLFSESQWSALSRFKTTLLKSGRLSVLLGKLAVPVIKLFPVRTQAVIKETINPVGWLDYKEKSIRMSAASEMQIYRMKACHKEPETILWIESHIKPGDIFYDVGANVGAYSFVAFVVAKGRVKIYAFEPSFSTFAELSKNIFLNSAQDKIVPLQIALSDQTKVSGFQYSDLEAGAASHVGLANTIANNTEPDMSLMQPLLGFKMDDLIDQFKLELPTLIKLDVDGHELQVLQGAEKTLSAPSVRSILVELDSTTQTGQQVIDYLIDRGFKVDSFHARGGSQELHNYIFVRHNLT